MSMLRPFVQNFCVGMILLVRLMHVLPYSSMVDKGSSFSLEVESLANKSGYKEFIVSSIKTSFSCKNKF